MFYNEENSVIWQDANIMLVSSASASPFYVLDADDMRGSSGPLG